jgi:hypothetical protein
MVGEEVGYSLGKRVVLCTMGLGVDVVPGVGVWVGILIRGLVLVGAALCGGVSVIRGVELQATCAATSTAQSAARVPFDRTFKGHLLSSISAVSSNIVAVRYNRKFQSELLAGYRNLLRRITVLS